MSKAKSLSCLLILLFSSFSFLSADEELDRTPHQDSNVVLQWSDAALQGVRDSKLGPPMVARALAIVHTCMYDAWALYNDRALPTEVSADLRRPRKERTLAHKREAITYAAYRGALDLFGPGDDGTVFRPLMVALGYDPDQTSTDLTTPAGIGNAACQAVLDFRHHDGSNQLGNLSSDRTPYADYTGYVPPNPPSPIPVVIRLILDPNRWQPLQYRDGTGSVVTQGFLGAHWGLVTPFSLSSGADLRPAIAQHPPALFGSAEYLQQAQDLVELSANLSDRQKLIAEYWKDGPRSETPPGHWCLLAHFVSERDHHTLDEDVKMFFAMTNATFDAGIVAWDAKRQHDSVRPASAIPYVFRGQTIRAWGGPGLGTVDMPGERWIPYQVSTFPTPPFPEFISGHSTFSSAAATVLRLFSGHDTFGGSVTFAPGSSSIEPGLVPAEPLTLSWPTFTAAADEAGISRRYGGIHFETGDLVGRAAGREVGRRVWAKASALWRGDKP